MIDVAYQYEYDVTFWRHCVFKWRHQSSKLHNSTEFVQNVGKLEIPQLIDVSIY